MKVSIIGSRDFTSYETFNSELEKLNLDITSIVSGGAIGTDTLAEQYATENNIPVEIIPP
jgi:predicted Rossmann fold nucleotide-binding protein DprA/Smf involved in DNA uptake